MINWRARAEAAEAIVREVRAAVQVPGAKDLPQAVRLLRKSESECAERAEVLRKQMAEVRAVAAEILSDDRSHGAPWLDRLSAALRVEGPAW
jgi:DNA topoisomerase VI subunit B